MNVEYAYIARSFLPEIVLVALALLVLVVDLLLPQRSTRRTLTVIAAIGCLCVGALTARQWMTTGDDNTAPTFIAMQASQLARGAIDTIKTRMELPAQADKLQPGDFTEVVRERGFKTSEGVWPFAYLTESQVQSLLGAAHYQENDIAGQPGYIMTNTEARNVVVAYAAAQREFPHDLSSATTLRHPGFGAWWLFAQDKFAIAFKLIFALAAALVLFLSTRFPVERYRGEFASMLLFATFGLMVMANSLDLVVLFLGLEVTALCLYALAAWHKGDARSAEAATKYLLLGSLASAFFIYGASLLFVRYGSTQIIALSSEITFHHNPLVIIAMLMVLVGFLFKVAAAPFHLWAPDVYQGAPTAVAAFLSTASKAAGFAVLLRVLTSGFLALSPQWIMLIGLVSGLSILIGNLVAIHQNNVKRLLAYSGIAQAGYLLIALLAVGLAFQNHLSAPQAGVQAIVFYLFLYTVGNIGAFAVTGIVARESGSDEMSAFAGLRTRAPLLAFAMLLLLLSLGGIPLLSGFVGKWYIFMSGVAEEQYLLVLLGAAMSVVSIYYYLLIAKQMYILPARDDAAPIRLGAIAGLGLLVIVLLTVTIGVYPKPFLTLADAAAQSLIMH